MSRDPSWDKELSRKLYGLENGVRGEFFDISDEGELVVRFNDHVISIPRLMRDLGLDNAYVRFLPLIGKMLSRVVRAFREAAERHGYAGAFAPVYPLKVTANDLVLREIARFGEGARWGFEVGTLGELEALAKTFDGEDGGDRLLVVDGFKGAREIELMHKMRSNGWHVVASVEGESDLKLLADDDMPLAIRLKPMGHAVSRWSGSGGLSSKFGLTLNGLERLAKDYPWIRDRAVMLHMHAGSQISDARSLRKYFREASRTFAGLVELGYSSLSYIDLGGGLAYPYLDTRDGSEDSPNYTVEDYFDMAIEELRSAGISPALVFEGGRYIVAAHRLVVAKVLEVRPFDAEAGPEPASSKLAEALDLRVRSLEELEAKAREAKHVIGKLEEKPNWSARDRMIIEDLRHYLVQWVVEEFGRLYEDDPRALEEVIKYPSVCKLLVSPSKRFVLSMSVFADVPDRALVHQYFQVVPAQRLNERPEVLATLSDITCDSMGEIREFYAKLDDSRVSPFTALDRRLMFIPGMKVRLYGTPLHMPRPLEDYYVVFLDSGAYQDMLTMRHNLVGDAPEVIIYEEGGELRVACRGCNKKGYVA
ncbi:MAG: decarboxylase [Desulfurococcaceae archaeon]